MNWWCACAGLCFPFQASLHWVVSVCGVPKDWSITMSHSRWLVTRFVFCERLVSRGYTWGVCVWWGVSIKCGMRVRVECLSFVTAHDCNEGSLCARTVGIPSNSEYTW